jgi:hypothetical protein
LLDFLIDVSGPDFSLFVSPRPQFAIPKSIATSVVNGPPDMLFESLECFTFELDFAIDEQKEGTYGQIRSRSDWQL